MVPRYHLDNFKYMNFKYAQYFTLVTFLFASCQKSEPHKTQSEYFNSLLNSAPIHVINLETPSSGTITFDYKDNQCIDRLLGDQGIRSIGDIHLFNDSLKIVSDISNNIVWVLDTLGRATRIAVSGNGPGEVFEPHLIHSLGDTLFIDDHKFVHAFDKSLNYMYRFPSRNYINPMSNILINPTHYMSQVSINEPGVRFIVYNRNKDSLDLKHSIFDLIIDPKTAMQYRLPFNSVIASLSKYDNTLLFYYYSSPYIFISDENGTISDILRLESSELLASEPTYSESDYSHVVQQNTGHGDFVPDPDKMKKFSTKVSDIQFLENGDIQFIYKGSNLLTLTNDNGKYRLVSKFAFNYKQNSQAAFYLTKIFQRKNGSYTGLIRPGGCIVNS